MVLRFAVFRLDYKTEKVKETEDGLEYEYKLVFKDGLGNKMECKGDRGDYDQYQPGNPLPWEMVLRQKTLDEGGNRR